MAPPLSHPVNSSKEHLQEFLGHQLQELGLTTAQKTEDFIQTAWHSDTERQFLAACFLQVLKEMEGSSREWSIELPLRLPAETLTEAVVPILVAMGYCQQAPEPGNYVYCKTAQISNEKYWYLGRYADPPSGLPSVLIKIEKRKKKPEHYRLHQHNTAKLIPIKQSEQSTADEGEFSEKSTPTENNALEKWAAFRKCIRGGSYPNKYVIVLGEKPKWEAGNLPALHEMMHPNGAIRHIAGCNVLYHHTYNGLKKELQELNKQGNARELFIVALKPLSIHKSELQSLTQRLGCPVLEFVPPRAEEYSAPKANFTIAAGEWAYFAACPGRTKPQITLKTVPPPEAAREQIKELLSSLEELAKISEDLARPPQRKFRQLMRVVGPLERWKNGTLSASAKHNRQQVAKLHERFNNHLDENQLPIIRDEFPENWEENFKKTKNILLTLVESFREVENKWPAVKTAAQQLAADGHKPVYLLDYNRPPMKITGEHKLESFPYSGHQGLRKRTLKEQFNPKGALLVPFYLGGVFLYQLHQTGLPVVLLLNNETGEADSLETYIERWRKKEYEQLKENGLLKTLWEQMTPKEVFYWVGIEGQPEPTTGAADQDQYPAPEQEGAQGRGKTTPTPTGVHFQHSFLDWDQDDFHSPEEEEDPSFGGKNYDHEDSSSDKLNAIYTITLDGQEEPTIYRVNKKLFVHRSGEDIRIGVKDLKEADQLYQYISNDFEEVWDNLKKTPKGEPLRQIDRSSQHWHAALAKVAKDLCYDNLDCLSKKFREHGTNVSVNNLRSWRSGNAKFPRNEEVLHVLRKLAEPLDKRGELTFLTEFDNVVNGLKQLNSVTTKLSHNLSDMVMQWYFEPETQDKNPLNKLDEQLRNALLQNLNCYTIKSIEITSPTEDQL